MNRDEKAAVIDEIADEIKEAQAVFAVDYRGLSVGQTTQLRSSLRDAGTSFRIVKNSLTERAAERADVPTLTAVLEGPTAFAFVRGDAAQAAKALSDFGRRSQALAFKGGVLNGQPLSAEQVQSIARLPARELLLAQFVGTVASPLTGLVRGLNALIGGLAYQLGQIAEQGLLPGGLAAASAGPDGASAAPETTSPDEAPAGAGAGGEAS